MPLPHLYHKSLTPHHPFHIWGVLSLLGAGLLVSGCSSTAPKNNAGDPIVPLPSKVHPIVPSPVRFTDITKAAGIKFRHNSGAFGLKLYPETMGSGVAVIDYDGDGYQDIFFVNGRDWTPAEAKAYTEGPGSIHHKEYGFKLAKQPPHRRTTGALYHNNGNGTFTDVTKGSGLDIEMQGMGVTVGDYDNDGRPDMYVTSYGRNYLFHNLGGGKFADVGKPAGVQDEGYSTSAMWVDYDRDGKLDLFVCHYIEWNPGIDIWNYGSLNKVNGGYLKTYAGPPGYVGQASHLFHNEGNGCFTNVSAKSGINAPVSALSAAQTSERAARQKEAAYAVNVTLGEQMSKRQSPDLHQGKSMGVALCDVNNDGWPDLLVTNDTVRNYLFVNNKNGTFKEVGVRSGLAYSSAGQSRAGMGVDVGDIDNSGKESAIIGNFDHEYLGLYYPTNPELYSDIASPTEVATPSITFLTFGCLFLDVNNDGWLDIMAANGHVQDTIHLMRRDLEYPQRPLLYLNRAQKQPIKFDEVGAQSGAAMKVPRVARGIVTGDFDLDGQLDVLLTINGGTPVLLHNSAASPKERNNALRLTLEGTKSNRSAIGALIEAKIQVSGNGTSETLRRFVKSGSTYLSQSELPVTLGLGHQTRVAEITIRWPSGKVTHLKNVAGNQALTVNEDRGITQQKALSMH